MKRFGAVLNRIVDAAIFAGVATLILKHFGVVVLVPQLCN